MNQMSIGGNYEKTIIISLILIISLVTVGCNNNNSNLSKEDNIKVTIEGHYMEPISLSDNETIVLEGLQIGEFVEFIVYGEIKNFKHMKIAYNSDGDSFSEVKELNSYDVLSDQTIVIKTYMPEGIPSELIKWESMDGEIFEFYISDYDLSRDSVKILEYIMGEG